MSFLILEQCLKLLSTNFTRRKLSTGEPRQDQTFIKTRVNVSLAKPDCPCTESERELPRIDALWNLLIQLDHTAHSLSQTDRTSCIHNQRPLISLPSNTTQINAPKSPNITFRVSFCQPRIAPPSPAPAFIHTLLRCCSHCAQYNSTTSSRFRVLASHFSLCLLSPLPCSLLHLTLFSRGFNRDSPLVSWNVRDFERWRARGRGIVIRRFSRRRLRRFPPHLRRSR